MPPPPGRSVDISAAAAAAAAAISYRNCFSARHRTAPTFLPPATRSRRSKTVLSGHTDRQTLNYCSTTPPALAAQLVLASSTDVIIPVLLLNALAVVSSDLLSLLDVQGGPKSGLFLRVDNFVTANYAKNI